MKFDENLASIHSYLCADGYVIKNPKTQKVKYYNIGFRNTNLVLLEDFQKKFAKFFSIVPHLSVGERCRIGSKEIYERLTKKFGSFYSAEWKMPKLNKRLSKVWLRSFFDCEGWVFCKSHKNRHVGLDSINENGLNQIISSLNEFGIKTIKKENKKRRIYRIFIYGQENLIKFYKNIGFLHPDKDKKLKEVLSDFVIYTWKFPKERQKCKQFVKNILKERIRIRKPYYVRIISKEENNIKELNKWIKHFYDVKGLVSKRINGLGTIYYELNINKRSEIEKLIKNKLIPNVLIKS